MFFPVKAEVCHKITAVCVHILFLSWDCVVVSGGSFSFMERIMGYGEKPNG